ncbi:MAG: SDR family NAD(P)-dependent oxidoreductase [Magnetococcus sp. YQC-5]
MNTHTKTLFQQNPFQPTHLTQHEPLAIIGMGCRFPGGANNPTAFWDLLLHGRDGVIDTPPERWNLARFYDQDPTKPGKLSTRQGGFLQEPIDGFDPLFFGISPRDAQAMDPQQRLLLEVVWEAMEDAGLDMNPLRGSDTGVYIGGFMQDFTAMTLNPVNRVIVNSSTAIGVNLAMLANRISHAFDFTGPSIAMDTACSSSLVTFHQACQAVWNKECSLAVSGGVNLMLCPEYFIALNKGQFLALDGRSKSFDARGDGYGRGEGAGIVIIKPWSVARRDGDRIYALVHATGINQDGHTNGITVPNAKAQQSLITKVCAAANISPARIRYVEAHGTGTALGDPIECQALGTIYGAGRSPGHPCLIGSVKSNIGHLEAAAGVAGLIKALLCLHHKQIPPQANLDALNPNIPFADLNLRVPRTPEPMPSGEGVAYVGVNSFGYGGTNAHAILSENQEGDSFGYDDANTHLILSKNQENQLPSDAPPPLKRDFLLPLSAGCDPGLKALAQRWLTWLSTPNPPALPHLAHAASMKRTHLERRLALVANSTTNLVEQLQAITSPDALVPPRPTISKTQALRPVFVLTGMGPQWWAMGRTLFQEEPLFRHTAETCDALFQQVSGWSILTEMTRDESESRITETQFAQPANFVLQVSLMALWRSWGVEPAAIVGHSLGEVSAAYASGALSLEDAILVSYHRSRLQQQAVGTGRMLAVGLAPNDCVDLLAGHHGSVVIAAINSPTSTNLAGDALALTAIAEHLEARGLFNRFLRVDIPYHSPAMDPLKPELRAALHAIQPRTPVIPLYSTVTGSLITGADMHAEYWVNNLREPVRFATAIETIIQDGLVLFLEVGPHPVLATSIQECLAQQGMAGETLFSLHRKKPERASLLETLGKLYIMGHPVAWKQFHPAILEQHLQLPTYPWQRDTYWKETQTSLQDRLYHFDHGLLAERLNTPNPTWESQLNAALLPYLNDHRVEQAVVFPGAGYVEIGLTMQRIIHGDTPCELEKIQFHQALVIGPGGDPTLRATCDAKGREFTIHSHRPDHPGHWTLHASGAFVASPPRTPPHLQIIALQHQCPESVEVEQVYAQLDAMGLHYGPWFRGIQQLWQGENAVLVQVAAHKDWDKNASAYRLHPTLLDACIQALMVKMQPNDGLYLPVGIQRIRFHTTPTPPFWGFIRVIEHNAKWIDCDLTLCDSTGQIHVEMDSLRCKAIPTSQPEDDASALDDWLYRPTWEHQERPVPSPTPMMSPGDIPIILLLDKGGMGEILAQQLMNLPVGRIVRVSFGHTFQHMAPDLFRIHRHNPADLQQLLTMVGPCRALVCLWELDLDGTNEDPVGINRVVDSLELIQALVKTTEKRHSSSLPPPRLFWVTRGAQPVQTNDTIPALAAAPVIGLARVAVAEHSSLRCTVLDLDPNDYNDHALSMIELAHEVLADSPDTEVAWRGGQRLVSRLVKEQASDWIKRMPSTHSFPGGDQNGSAFALEQGKPGLLNSLQLRACERRAPGPGEVEIEIHTAGIGLRDLDRLTRQDPSELSEKKEKKEKNFFGAGIGMEISGVVSRKGPGVHTLAKGDAILALVPGGCRSHITLPINAIWTMPRPAGIGDAESGGLFLAFLTAFFAIHRAALETGEKVLIHAAHSGMGLAAIQVAQWQGAELFVTADTPEKRHHLRSLGIRHVLDTHVPTLIEEIMAATDDQGVDVILHTLGGESIQQTLQALAPFGRFVQMGACGQASSWNQAELKHNITYMSVDLDHLARRRDLMPKMLEALSNHFASGTFKPLHTHVFPADRATEGFAHLQSGQLGKAVLDMRGTAPMTILPSRKQPPLFRADGTYLITGGFGSFGMELAEWMGRQGVRQLVLTGRRGAEYPSAKQVVDKLESNGIRVMAVAMDVTNATEMTRLIERISQTMPPLRGVVHAAAVLDDGLIMDLDRARMTRVMAPKALGAWNLHQATKQLALDFFVLFSSVSSLIGNAGQGNYVAANAFLDALSHARRAAGLPATSINWGALSEVGMAARDKEVERRLQRGGIHSISAAQAMTAFAQVLRWHPAQLGILHMNWETFAQTNPLVTRLPRYSRLITADPTQSSQQKVSQLLVQLKNTSETLRHATMVDHIRTLVAKILGIPNLDRVLPHVQLFDLGIDSLTAVELKNKLEAEMGLALGSSLVFNYPTIDALATFLMATLFADQHQPQESSDNKTASPPQPLVDPVLEKISDEEAETLLLQELLNDMAQFS